VCFVLQANSIDIKHSNITPFRFVVFMIVWVVV
jgi:hypothetical protein